MSYQNCTEKAPKEITTTKNILLTFLGKKYVFQNLIHFYVEKNVNEYE